MIVRPPDEIWDGVDTEDPVETEDIAHVEQYLYGMELPVSTITGIEQNLFPPPGKLTDDQMALLAKEMELLLNHHNLYPDFPANFPEHFRYPLLCSIWNEKFVPLSFGENHIEFCSYEQSQCPFPGYCTTCDEMKAEEESGFKSDGFPDDFNIDNLLNFKPPPDR